MSNCLDPDQEIILIWVQTVWKGYQQMTKVPASKERVMTFAQVVLYAYTAIWWGNMSNLRSVHLSIFILCRA